MSRFLFEWYLAWYRAVMFPLLWMTGLEATAEAPPELQLPPEGGP